jgi:hypothetical protein
MVTVSFCCFFCCMPPVCHKATGPVPCPASIYDERRKDHDERSCLTGCKIEKTEAFNCTGFDC